MNNKKLITNFLITALLLTTLAQASTYGSNLQNIRGDDVVATCGVGAGIRNGHWSQSVVESQLQAQPFNITGTGTYNLTNISFKTGYITSNGNVNVRIELYNDTYNQINIPHTRLAYNETTISNDASYTNANTSAIFTYSFSNIPLEYNTRYWIIFSSSNTGDDQQPFALRDAGTTTFTQYGYIDNTEVVSSLNNWGTCYAPFQLGLQEATIPNLPTINTFTTTNNTIQNGTSTTLNWTTTDATNLDLNGVNVTGYLSANVTPVANTTYTLTATNENGSVNSNLTIYTYQPTPVLPTIHTFTTSNNSILNGTNTTLSWTLGNTTDIDLNGQNLTGYSNALVSPVANTTYTLTATNENGSVNSNLTISVYELPVYTKPTINTFTTTNDTIQNGSSALLTWTTVYATNLDLSGVNVTGLLNYSVMPNITTKYTLTATNENGSVNSNKTIFVYNIVNGTAILYTEQDVSPIIVDSFGKFMVGLASTAVLIGGAVALGLGMKGYKKVK